MNIILSATLELFISFRGELVWFKPSNDKRKLRPDETVKQWSKQ